MKETPIDILGRPINVNDTVIILAAYTSNLHHKIVKVTQIEPHAAYIAIWVLYKDGTSDHKNPLNLVVINSQIATNEKDYPEWYI